MFRRRHRPGTTRRTAAPSWRWTNVGVIAWTRPAACAPGRRARGNARRRPAATSVRVGRPVTSGIRRAARSDASAFSYSILITATFGMVDLRAGDATAPRLFAFAIGATLAFAAVEAVASAGFEIVIHEERSDVMLVGTSLAPIAVSLGLGAAYAVTTVLRGVGVAGRAAGRHRGVRRGRRRAADGRAATPGAPPAGRGGVTPTLPGPTRRTGCGSGSAGPTSAPSPRRRGRAPWARRPRRPGSTRSGPSSTSWRPAATSRATRTTRPGRPRCSRRSTCRTRWSG